MNETEIKIPKNIVIYTQCSILQLCNEHFAAQFTWRRHVESEITDNKKSRRF